MPPAPAAEAAADAMAPEADVEGKAPAPARQDTAGEQPMVS